MPYDQTFIRHRFSSLLKSRLDDPITKQALVIQATYIGGGGTHTSAIARGYGELIRRHRLPSRRPPLKTIGNVSERCAGHHLVIDDKSMSRRCRCTKQGCV